MSQRNSFASTLSLEEDRAEDVPVHGADALQCATPSGSVSQTASVRGGGNSYQGSFYNAEYDASGTIFIVVRGRNQTVRLISNKGSALLRLSR